MLLSRRCCSSVTHAVLHRNSPFLASAYVLSVSNCIKCKGHKFRITSWTVVDLTLFFSDFHKIEGSSHIFQYTLPATSEFSVPRNPICLHVPLSLGWSYRSQQPSFAFFMGMAMATGRASYLTPSGRKMSRLRSKWTGNSAAQMCIFQPLTCVRLEMSYLARTAQKGSLLVIYAYRNNNW